MSKSAADRARALRAKEIISISKPDFSQLTLNNENYDNHLGRCLTWMSQEFRSNQKKPFLIEWATEQGYDVEALEAVDDWKFMTIGGYAFILLNGGELNERMANRFYPVVDELIAEGKKLKAKAEEKETSKKTKIIRNLGLEIADEVQDLVINREADDETVSDLLMKSGLNTLDLSTFVNKIEEILGEWNGNEEQLVEMRELAGDETAEYFRSAYFTVIKIAGMVEENFKAERKASKKKKGFSAAKAERAVKNTRTKKIDTTYNIVSLPPEEVFGSRILLTFNTKNRRLGYYVAKEGETLSIKGTTIQNYDETKSFSKITRKPERDLPMFRSAKNERRIEVVINTINGVTHKLNGRLNSDTTLLKVFK